MLYKEAVFEEALRAACRARKNAYAPYSGFPVGASLVTRKGAIFTGCNIENASFGLTLCAERVALGAAVSSGQQDFYLLVLLADADPPPVPCGACRQVLQEFAPRLQVVACNLAGQRVEYALPELLPHAFSFYRQAEKDKS